MPDVEQTTGYKRSRIYDLVALGSFPKPVKLGARAVAWRSDELDAWVASRQRAEYAPPPK
jgi:prophage regulatory protein